jgi:uncharacterized protein (DUF305 family)
MTKTALTAIAFTAMLACSAQAADDMSHKECMPMVKTGNADVDFIRNMIPHHKMALEMSEKQMKEGKDDEARSMAKKIIEGQKKEISEMEGWLKSHQ